MRIYCLKVLFLQTKLIRSEPATFIANASAPGAERHLELYGGRNKLWGMTALIPNNDCIEFRQKKDYTWVVIIATIGGTMEFWIGASLLSFVQFLIFIVDYVRFDHRCSL